MRNALHSDTTEYRVSAPNLEGADVAVVGAGIAGVFSALGASDMGAEVALIEQHGFVGGQGTAGGVHTFCGETRVVNRCWSEMISRLANFHNGIADYRPNVDGRRFDVESLKFVLQEMLAERNVRLMLHTQLVDIDRDDDAVVGLFIHNKTGIQRLPANYIIDATGDADVLARGGWSFEKGGPVFGPGAKAELIEAEAHLQLPMSLYFSMIDTGEFVTPYLPEVASVWEGDEDIPMTTVHQHDGYIVVKMKVIGHDATDGESLSLAEQAGRRQMMALVYHLQTKGYRGVRYDTYELGWVAPHIGVREGRRINGQYKLKVSDVLEGRRFEDAIAVGSYHLDYHWPTTVRRDRSGLATQAPPYQIPLRALRPTGTDNVLVPGRGVSGEQLAMSSFRVMGTCAQTGFGAGLAAGLAVSKECALDDLSSSELRESLQGAGVCFDFAPYTNYLRENRHIDETIARRTPGTRAVGPSLVMLPDGDFVCSWWQKNDNGKGSIVASTRRQSTWGEPVVAVQLATDEPIHSLLALSDQWSFGQSTTEQRGRSTQSHRPRNLEILSALTDPKGVSIIGVAASSNGASWQVHDRPQSISRPAIIADLLNLSDKSRISLVHIADDVAGQLLIFKRADLDGSWDLVNAQQVEKMDRRSSPVVWDDGRAHLVVLYQSGIDTIRLESNDLGSSWSPPEIVTFLPTAALLLGARLLVPSPGDPGFGNDEPAPLAIVHTSPSGLTASVSYDNGLSLSHSLELHSGASQYSNCSLVPTATGFAVAYGADTELRFGEYALEHLRDGVDPVPEWHMERDWLDLLASTEHSSI